jgi:uncharacterized protein with ParB-like and HNH nuclease domain
MGLEVLNFTPSTVGKRLFSIPIYQRLYAWETEQVKQLLEDLLDGFNTNPSKHYFVGSVIKSHIADNHRSAIIDGQQRLTTFWLMGFVLKTYYGEWSKFLQNGDVIRLSFTAREDDSSFFSFLADNACTIESALLNTSGFNVNPTMLNTIQVVNHFFNNHIHQGTRYSFAKYIYEHAVLVDVTLPNNIDLNRYFEIMNNRGVQLEKHQILKARLLSKLREDERTVYSVIWDGVSQMSKPIEKCLVKKGESIGEIRKEILSLIDTSFQSVSIFIDGLTKDEKAQSKKLSELLKEAGKMSESPSSFDLEDSDYINSIVNFPTFLLHVYMLFSDDAEVRLKDKDLLKIIHIDTREDVIEYLNLLLILRILFDQYIIKNYKVGNNNIWETRILTIGENEEERKSQFKASTQIMSMLNVSTSTEYWLSIVLKYLKAKISIKDNDFVVFLENLDYCFAYARLQTGRPMSEMAKELFGDMTLVKGSKKILVTKELLSNGTNTDHYWFHKLDYCLWKKWNKHVEHSEYEKEIGNFQFRTNRSIEHIYPQNPEDGNYWYKEIHSFGNLALISVNSNSEYSRHGFEWKRGQFKDRKQRGAGIESLKLVDVYTRDQWNEEECELHQDKMIRVLNEYHENFIQSQTINPCPNI